MVFGMEIRPNYDSMLSTHSLCMEEADCIILQALNVGEKLQAQIHTDMPLCEKKSF